MGESSEGVHDDPGEEAQRRRGEVGRAEPARIDEETEETHQTEELSTKKEAPPGFGRSRA